MSSRWLVGSSSHSVTGPSLGQERNRSAFHGAKKEPCMTGQCLRTRVAGRPHGQDQGRGLGRARQVHHGYV